MKAIDLLKYLELADPAYVAEASDCNLLLYRKRRKRTIRALAACFALVVLGSIVFAKPALHAWETRNTVTSWNDSLLGVSSKPSPSVMVSAEMPAQKRFAADTPFTLSVGMGQVADYEYATLSVTAYGFEITDKDGNTATDRYVRTLSAFNSGDYGVTYNDRHKVTGCTYLEDFTLRFVGSENTTGWGVIEFSLQSRDESSTMGDSVTVWYTLQNGVLKLSDKRPKGNGQEGEHVILTDPGPYQHEFSVRVSLDPTVLYLGQYLEDSLEITARHKTYLTEYSTDGFTAELVYAETLRQKDYSFFIQKPAEQSADGFAYYFVPLVPEDAPIGSYDLRITDPATGFVWMFENMALVLPEPPKEDPDFGTPPPYEDLICEAEAFKATLMQGEDFKDAFDFTLMQNGEDMSFFCKAELVYAGDGGEACTITVQDSPFSSHLPASYIPVDAPVGEYDLIITDERYGYTWLFNHIVEILPSDEKLDRFVFSTDIEDQLTVSRSSHDGWVPEFTATIRNRGRDFTLYITPEKRFEPEVKLTMTGTDGTVYEIQLLIVIDADFEPFNMLVHTNDPSARRYMLNLINDPPCGFYDLTLSYEDCTVTFEGVVEVVP